MVIRVMKIKIMNRSFLKSICGLLLIGLFAGCESDVYNEEKKIDNAIWTYANPIEFSFAIEDTTSLYNIFLETKHKEDFPSANAYAKLFVGLPNGTIREQQVSLELADPKGEWYGKCSGGNCLNRLSFMPKANFDQVGIYKIRFEQYTRKDSLEGIESLRLIVEKVKEK